MRLLILTDWPYPCDLTMLQEIFSKRLTAQGHDIVWVMRPDGDNIDIITSHSWNGNKVYVPPIKSYDPKRTMFRYITGTMSKHPVIKSIPDVDQFDLVHVRNDFSMGLLAMYYKENHSLPYAHQISHLKSEALIELVKQRESNSPVRDLIRGGLGQYLRRFIMQNADVILTISDAMNSRFKKDGYPEPIVTFPTGADTSIDPSSIDAKTFREKYQIPDGRLLLYNGSMSPLRRLEFLFEMLSYIEEDVTLLMVGGRDAGRRDRLKKKAEKQEVDNDIIFTGWVESHDIVKQAIRAADIGLSPLPPTPLLQTNAPLKVLEYLSLETPVVATDTPDQRTVIEESGGGSIASYEPKAFADTINQVLESPNDLKTMGENGRRYIKRERSFDVLTESLLDIYNQYLHNPTYKD